MEINDSPIKIFLLIIYSSPGRTQICSGKVFCRYLKGHFLLYMEGSLLKFKIENLGNNCGLIFAVKLLTLNLTS